MKKFLLGKMSLRSIIVLFAFLITFVIIALSGLVMFLTMHFGERNFIAWRIPFSPLHSLSLFSLLMGLLLAAIVNKLTVKPLRKVMDAMHRVAEGDFSVQIETNSVPEIEDLTASFNKMVRELAGIETLRSDFISNFSHEFKTPIVSIRGFAKLLSDKSISEDERSEYAGIIVQETERLAGLASSILELSKLENTAILANKCSFWLDEQIRRVVALFEPRWQAKGIGVALELEDVMIYCDEDLLRQVWVNLLDNAVKFTDNGGSIDIRLTQAGQNAHFYIRDNGCGISEDELPHLFDKFYQGDKSHSRSGNGLGLALAKQIVFLCDGEISAEGAPGQGSIFRVALPVKQQAKYDTGIRAD